MVFGTKFSRNTLSKPQYRSLWHPKYTQEVVTQKEPGFSFKLAMGCFKAIALKVLVTIELLLSSRKHNTEKPQSEKEASKVIQKAIAPPLCSIKNSEPDKMLQTLSTQEFQQSDRTFMLCFVGLRPYLVYRVFILKLELVKLEIKQKLENLLVPETKTSQTKFKDVRRARRKNNYFYYGVEVSSRSALNRRGDELISLKPGTKVKISTDYHSSSLSDNNLQILVYVRPIEIKTKEKYLVPLNTLIHITTNSDSYVKAVLPQIKDLVAALGLTKEDYLQHIQQTYGVERTGCLWPKEIFEVVNHFQNLFYSMFDGCSKVLNGSYLRKLEYEYF